MTAPFRLLLRALSALAFAVAAPAFAAEAMVADAPPGAVRVLASTGLRAVLESVHGEAEKAVGHPVVIQFGSSRALQGVIEGGQPFEVTVVTPEVLEPVIAKGAVRAGSRRDIARTLVALAQRGGTPGRMDSREALRSLLLGAKAIRYNPIGSGRGTIDGMFAGTGIDQAALGAKIQPLPSAANPPATLGPGEYELTIVLNSEVPDLAPGAVNLGPIPAPYQIPVVMAAGVGAKGDPALAKAMLDFLQGPAVTRALLANRMVRIESSTAAPAAPSLSTSRRPRSRTGG